MIYRVGTARVRPGSRPKTGCFCLQSRFSHLHYLHWENGGAGGGGREDDMGRQDVLTLGHQALLTWNEISS